MLTYLKPFDTVHSHYHVCRFDPLGLCPKNQQEFDDLQTKELNNGRLAMISVAGFVAQELVNKKGIIENLQE